ncbi:TusE/DsrC/DsvC family sulfur relay protein [Ectothiorhodospiraceae bacterium 2226]|nr:TusE/DsrC/DsvC family sulfur relay protein [Ectothiorhodospiraceae bacterium 2226]
MDIFGNEFGDDPLFPNAPVHWRQQDAAAQARAEGLALGADHWDAVRAMQEYYARHVDGGINMRELHDALDERFHPQGGIKYLYLLFPGGPIAQGCRLAGLHPPAGALDRGFGSVA